jgi:hypothetical protein
LCITAIHTAPEMDTEWLAPADHTKGTAC